jgi:REP element-mobilizing transposase RayT
MIRGVSHELWYCCLMARPLRIEFPGALYHVVARGNERKAIFRDNADREFYLRRLAHYREKFGFSVWAYCLMDNHVHLGLEMGKVPLSRVMAGLQTSYTQYFNRRHRRAGHLFQGRYKAFLVEKDRYALAMVRYIHENPIKAGMAKRAGEHAWSSDRFFRQGEGPAWLDLDRVLPLLGRTRSAAAAGYRRLMRETAEQPYDELPAHGQIVKGEETFADRVLAEAGEPPPVRRKLRLDTAASVVSRGEGVSLVEMKGTGRGRRASRARLLAAWIGREVGGISLSRAARFFGRDPSTFARGVGELEEAIGRDAALKARVGRLARETRRRAQ